MEIDRLSYRIRAVKLECVVHELGLVAYEPAWRLQDRLAVEIAGGKRLPTLLLLEHPHTFTFGRSGKAENLLWGAEEMARRGVSVHWVDRGGDVTYHGPGQLVGYPLLPLGSAGLQTHPDTGAPRLPQADYVGYIRKLELTLIRALANFGVDSTQIPGLTGVWIPAGAGSGANGGAVGGTEGRLPAKIAAIGVKVDARGVSRHGFALNVNPDMSYWEGIIGCGLADFPVTSLSELVTPMPSLEKVVEVVIQSFGEVFHFQMIKKEREVFARDSIDSV